jgi:hypothetical protein
VNAGLTFLGDRNGAHVSLELVKVLGLAKAEVELLTELRQLRV